MGLFVSLDGHRMHIAEIPGLTEKIPQGIWIYALGNKKQISLKEPLGNALPYPDFKALSDLSEKHELKGTLVHADDTSALWMFYDMTGIKCNIDYLMDVCRESDALDVYCSPTFNAAVYFVQEGPDGYTKKAVLMPLTDKQIS
jgi:hypothetical protein